MNIAPRTPRPSARRLDLAEGRVDLTHGAGGRAMQQLIEEIFRPAFDNPMLARGDDQAAFEETLHVVVRPPTVWRARGGYAIRLGSHDQHSIGLVADFLDVPKREDSRTIRVGPIARMVLSRRVELRASFVIPIVSPDNLKLVGGDFGELGVRYRWASE